MKSFLLSFLARWYLELVGATSRIVWENRRVRDRLEAEGRGIIYAFWHGRQVFLVYLHRGDRLHALISRSGDGEIIARVCRAFGLLTIRGSSSRGGADAVREILTALEAGDRVSITPDGPRGPLRQVQPGILLVAQKTGRPIVPVAYGARRRWVFKGSWDEFIVPKPFNRIAMVYGEPLVIGPEDDLTKRAADLQKELDHVSLEADKISR